MDIKELMENQNHLNSSQKEQLKQLFFKHKKLFDGTLGLYPHKKIHIEVLPDAQPKHQRPSPNALGNIQKGTPTFA